jgi:hypothetical protein
MTPADAVKVAERAVYAARTQAEHDMAMRMLEQAREAAEILRRRVAVVVTDERTGGE